MFDERLFIQRVERAGIQEFAQILARPTIEEERALRAYVGDERFRRLHGIALRQRVRSATTLALGNVVVIHGIMGGELTAFRNGNSDHVWAHPAALLQGKVMHLRLADDGRTDVARGTQVRATGIMKSAYGEILLSLAEHWNVRGFWYDWRKDLSLAAGELETRINAWFGTDTPVHLVAHSMGGLVARTFIRERKTRWDQMWSQQTRGQLGGRLIMLGTPNHGSFAVPQIITGLEGIVRKLALLDLHHSLEELLPVFNSFCGSYQMLPSPLVMPGIAWLYDAKSYGGISVPQMQLDNARQHHDLLKDIIDTERMRYIAGFNLPTFDGLRSRQPADRKAYTVTRDGDGRVPHRLGFLDGVANYFVDEIHGDLPGNDNVIAAVEELLVKGDTTALPTTLPRRRTNNSTHEEDAASVWTQQDAEVREIEKLSQRSRARIKDPEVTLHLTSGERAMRENLLSNLVPNEKTHRSQPRSGGNIKPIRIRLTVAHALIQNTASFDARGLPVDAIAVGHYIGVKPQNAELALDHSISEALGSTSRKKGADLSDGVLAQFAERGILRGELGQPFFINDPRSTGSASRRDRIIAIAGMGYPGRFGEPELTVATRELCWCLGRLRKRHLASVLIGGGEGNMDIRIAVGAWLRGIRRALAGSVDDTAYHLKQITFVESDPRRVTEIHQAILAEKANFAGELDIRYDGLSEAQLSSLGRDGSARARTDWLRKNARPYAHDTRAQNAAPTRLTIELNEGVYRFGAITDSASIPERTIPLDPSLVLQANEELIAQTDQDLQRERGELLGKLLVPTELRDRLTSNSPIILTMDSTTARIHWELVAHDDSILGVATGKDLTAKLDTFLGTSRGLTRQLRTTFAPPPEPPPPARRMLRVLIVADPAADAHLPGAEEEGAEVADLFRSFNSAYSNITQSRVEVVTLFGPNEATRTNVLAKLMTSPFDVLHFAGHCTYSTEPNQSGWVFTNNKVLSANELNRIDRIPKFVFSNACESGVIPDRPGNRNVALAPSFAESFFARGVANFVCTAWPVDDTAAREFALTLYGRLLGLTRDGSGRYVASPPVHMHEAMRNARRTIALTMAGAHTWGAYQHYGNPYLQLFDTSSLQTNASLQRTSRRRQQ